jgi:hypothetical protein
MEEEVGTLLGGCTLLLGALPAQQSNDAVKEIEGIRQALWFSC